MKNTLTINANDSCKCECLDKIDDGTNSIWINVVTYTEGVLEFLYNGETMVEAVTEEPFEVPSEWYLTEDLQFRFVDSHHTGDYFTFHHPPTTKGDMWMAQVSDNQFEYDIRFHEPDTGGGGGGEYTLPAATTTTLGGIMVGSGLSVKSDGTLSADAQKIDVDDALSDTSKNPVQNKVITARLDEVFQSVSDGKSAIASAITDKGVYTGNGSTFKQMASNILRINQNGAGGVNVFFSDQAVVFEDLNEMIGCEVSVERAMLNRVPIMTSNEYTDSSGTYKSSASTVYSTSYAAYKAFNEDTGTYWGTKSVSAPHWIKIEFPKQYSIEKYVLRAGYNNAEYPKTWTLQGSNDGENYVDIDAREVGSLLSDGNVHEFDVQSIGSYKIYRLYVTVSQSCCGLSIFKLLAR